LIFDMSTPAEAANAVPIPGQMNDREREFLTGTILDAAKAPEAALEVGTWLGGGSTLHILRAMEKLGRGHLWGIEASRSIYEQMVANITAGAPDAVHRFSPLFGLSQHVIPRWLSEQASGFEIDFAFLDGGDNPHEQIVEFQLIDPRIPVGGQLLAHDARVRKGKWLVPYLLRLDNWRTEVHDFSEVGLLHARKTALRPSPASLRFARQHLLKARLQPSEVAAAMLPAALCRFILRRVPRRVFEWLWRGANAR
jgi:predicted O-methyltransferase YrrM